MKYTAAILLVLYAFYTHAQQKPEDILSKMVANIKAHQSLNYTVLYTSKYETSGTSNTLNSMVYMQRDEADTIWGGMVWISEEPKTGSIYSFYDRSKTYTVMPPIGKAYGDRPVKNRLGLSIDHNGLVWTDFLHPTAMERKYTKAKDITLLKDTTINGKQCYQVSLTPYYGASQVFETEVLCINKTDHFPILITNTEVAKSGIHKTVMAFSNYAFDQVSPDKFSPKQIPATYSIGTHDRAMPKGVQVEPRIDKSQFPLPGNRRR